MGRIGLALKILFSGKMARRVLDLLDADSGAQALPESDPDTEPAPPPEPKPKRSDAVSLLSALQREARFVDFIQEPIDAYSDAQVGAAVREVHRGCGEVLARMFGLAPVVDQPEESDVEVTDPASGAWRLTGNVAQSTGTVNGKLVHHGWAATKSDVPEWTGDDSAINIVAAAEVQIS